MAKDEKKEQDELLSDITPVGIVCFPHVWEPYAFKGSDGKTKEPNYSLILVLEEGTSYGNLKRITGNAIKKKWGDKGKILLAKKKLSLPWRDADEYDKYGEPFVEGNIMLNMKSRTAPGIVNARAKPITNQMDFYAGCRARCSVYAHAFDTMGNMGVTFLLNNVQKAGDGTRLNGRMPAEDEFEALEEESGDEDLEGLL